MRKVLVLLFCLMMLTLSAEAKWVNVVDIEKGSFSVDDSRMDVSGNSFYFWYSAYSKESRTTYVCRAQVDMKSLYARDLFTSIYQGNENNTVDTPTRWYPVIPGSAFDTVINKAIVIYSSSKDNA